MTLPEGKEYADRFVFVYGICLGDEMVGCVDLVRGWPDAQTAMLGLLLVVESLHGQGIGRAAHARVEGVVRGWGACTRMRIGVLRRNPAARAFRPHSASRRPARSNRIGTRRWNRRWR